MKGTLTHEFGHVFGATDKYRIEGDDPFDQWSVMDSARIVDTSDYSINSPNAMALDKLETGMLESTEISSGGLVSLSGIADTLAPLVNFRKRKGLARPL